ncbi:patatin-like phospholipase family protein [Confluentibacter flavum]|uniref:Patatin n=1 Tax=Confluentibacter flavum TaxID=1909700 RepID=A0A2N3HLJ3_9FLAO|nr:patatin-like phospholipase family protein [Confluentibacter flavum]PKQ45833.1 patatin [Confluentibacter flavum]
MKHIITILVFFICFQGLSQETEKKDMKVGLVLSGGGAKGLAHIGVLKVIDSLGVRIDYIAGTSMGAIVGSLYASGYSGKQIDSIFQSVNFDDILNDHLPRASKTFYERDNNEKYAFTLPFKNFKIKLPSALSRGQNTLGLLSKATLHVNTLDDFCELPIPFFCVATNIETGKAVVLDKGNLSQAVMASGAFPSLFQPVIIDDQVLIDGGVVNNYPIDELREKGMDVIIGVDVQDGFMSREQLTSAPDVLLQINNFRTINDMKIKAKKTDIYIKPDISNFSVVSFSELKKITKTGAVATLNHAEALTEITKFQSKKREQIQIKPVDSLKINTINLSGENNYTRSYVLGKLKLKTNEKISYDDFNKGVNNLIATNNFDSFLYELKPSESIDGYDMNAHLKESNETTFLKLGLHYDDLYKSSALINLTKKRLLTKNDLASFDFILGDNVRYNFDYYIDRGFYWSIGLNSRYDNFNHNVAAETILSPEQLSLININKLAIQVSDFTHQIYIQTLFRKDLSLTLGAEYKHLKITSETILNSNDDEESVFERGDYTSVFGKLRFDTYDNKYFPKNGVLFNADFHTYLHASEFKDDFSSFSIAKATFGFSQSFSKKFSANITTDAGFRVGQETNPYLNFVLGGYGGHLINNYMPFYGYDFLSISGNSFIKSALTLDYEIFKKNHLNFAVNMANVGNDLFEGSEWFSKIDYTGYALGYALETFIGPIEIKYSWSPETKKSIWFFNVGFWF